MRHCELTSLFNRLDISSNEIAKYIVWDYKVPYTRNKIATSNDKYELLVLCWNPGKESKIHNHPGDGCYVKVISGSMKESIYKVSGSQLNRLSLLSESTASSGHVCYIDDSVGLHRLGNPTDEGAITLHLYTPPVTSCKVSNYNFENISFHNVLVALGKS